MPTTYTHYKFGKDVLEQLPGPLRSSVEKHRELFDIGLHGPDILFYYHPLHWNPVNTEGSQIHGKMADEFFEKAVSVIKSEEDPAAARSYIYGFICHFALDSICHKYIEKMIQVSGICHYEIEMELDRYLMIQDGLDPITYIPTGHLVASRKNAEVIAPFFESLDVDTAQKTLRSMRVCLKFLMFSGEKRDKMIQKTLRMTGFYDKYGLFMSEQENPDCEKYCEILLEKYNEALPEAVELIQQYQRVLFENEKLSEKFHATFSAGDDWEKLEL